MFVSLYLKQNFEVTTGSESRLKMKGLTNGSREADERNPDELKQTGASNSAEDKIAEQTWQILFLWSHSSSVFTFADCNTFVCTALVVLPLMYYT